MQYVNSIIIAGVSYLHIILLKTIMIICLYYKLKFDTYNTDIKSKLLAVLNHTKH